MSLSATTEKGSVNFGIASAKIDAEGWPTRAIKW